MANVKSGDKVSWQSHGGTAEGKVVRKVTAKTHIKGHTVAATKHDPQFVVETGDGKKVAHKPEALKKR